MHICVVTWENPWSDFDIFYYKIFPFVCLNQNKVMTYNYTKLNQLVRKVHTASTWLGFRHLELLLHWLTWLLTQHDMKVRK